MSERRQSFPQPPQWMAPPSSAGTIVPYDYAAKFKLTGRLGNALQDVITISPDGVFVATAIGYGFEEIRERPLTLQQIPNPVVPEDIKLGHIPIQALISGVRANPKMEGLLFQDRRGLTISADPLTQE